jgi:High potential iron-sulfur protein
VPNGIFSNHPRGFCQYQGHPLMTSRRQFIAQISVGTTTFAAAHTALAQAPMVAETDANAKALGYFADASKTDKVKYPKYAKEQLCSNCALYQGKATDAAGACPLFAGKQVAGKGWCSAWAKKA